MENSLARHGGVSYLEVPVTEPRRSAEFYADVLGWKLDERAKDDFRFSDRDGLMIGRFAMGRAIAREAGMMLFVYVDSLDDAVARVRAKDGEIVEAPRKEGDVRIARVRDPAGNLIGLWQFGG